MAATVKFLKAALLAFAWAYRTGEWLHTQKPLPFKQTLQRPLKNRFRYGFEHIRNIVINRYEKWRGVGLIMQFSFCT